MSMMRIVIAGAAGRMGQAILREILAAGRMKVVAGLEMAGHPLIGADMAAAAGGQPAGATITADPLAAIAAADAVIDFSHPDASVANAALCAQARIVHVIGTTGFSASQRDAIGAAARHATVIRSGNMSLGVNLLLGLVELGARALGPDWDIEVLEMHHRMKIDAPSGTALMLAEAAARGRGAALDALRQPPRDGMTGKRPEGGIGFASLRGGSVVGDHTVFLAGQGERIELSHRAEDRAIFARGAIAAAAWGHGKGPGLFDMQDVLGLRSRGQ